MSDESHVAYPVCDSHIHFYDNDYPTWSQSQLSHHTTTFADYRAVQAINGASRFVVVQPSTYGFDNRVLVQALKAANGAAKGVAVVSADSSSMELQRLRQVGVVGLRANLTLGPHALDDLPNLARRAMALGFHLQLNISGRQLIEHIDEIELLPVPVVIDHCGYLCREPEVAASVFAAILRLLAKKGRWLKLSGPYVASLDAENDYADLLPFIGQLIEHFPEQLVYGSDWPHVTEPTQPGERHLFEIQRSWFARPGLEQMILSSNPARLYGFDDGIAARADQTFEPCGDETHV
ncbi:MULTISPECIES: amidohydrolase family protein [Paraburkholderia]|uniref:amidohydrolase family protein n=1 Tax=Paraburkholderia TaxID=1822464 RepID=UPI0038B954C3